jgi:two-component system response regulator AtoC
MNRRILVVDDEETQADIIADILLREGYEAERVYSAEEALRSLSNGEFAVVLIDLKMPGLGGLGFLGEIDGKRSRMNIIIMTAYGTIDTAVEAMRRGAFDYITKPFSKDELVINVERAVQSFNIVSQNAALRETLRTMYGEQRFIGTSEAIRRIVDLIDRISRSDAGSVLITGESGTGKELVARAIHTQSQRADMSFVPVNCSAIPDTLLESELFGYVRGAFTGAVSDREGKFKKADGGTVFLDEIGDMAQSMQVKLLRVLQDGEVAPVGGDESYRVDVRVIAATNRDIARMVEEGTFREDLYYRLNVVPIHIPPLRERREDIPVLVDYIIERLNVKLKKSIRALPGELLRRLRDYSFPGNVRELENMLERAFILADGDTLDVKHFPNLTDGGPVYGGNGLKSLKDISRRAREEAEREAIVEALKKTHWNRVKTARMLDIDYKTLRKKISELHIVPEYTGKGENNG